MSFFKNLFKEVWFRSFLQVTDLRFHPNDPARKLCCFAMSNIIQYSEPLSSMANKNALIVRQEGCHHSLPQALEPGFCARAHAPETDGSKRYRDRYRGPGSRPCLAKQAGEDRV